MDLPTNGMRELSLFTGGGGGVLGGLLLGWRSVCYVERDEYCQRIIQQRIADGMFHDAPIWDDVRTFDGKPWRGAVDIITAGFPCQPFSVAGKQLGEDDERNCWPDTIRIIREVRPRYCLLENVPALITSGYFGTILGDLAESGFDARWDVFSAAHVGAPHLRKRLWIVPHATSFRCKREGGRGILGAAERNTEERATKFPNRFSWWAVEPDVGRVADGVASELDESGTDASGELE